MKYFGCCLVANVASKEFSFCWLLYLAAFRKSSQNTVQRIDLIVKKTIKKN